MKKLDSPEHLELIKLTEDFKSKLMDTLSKIKFEGDTEFLITTMMGPACNISSTLIAALFQLTGLSMGTLLYGYNQKLLLLLNRIEQQKQNEEDKNDG